MQFQLKAQRESVQPGDYEALFRSELRRQIDLKRLKAGQPIEPIQLELQPSNRCAVNCPDCITQDTAFVELPKLDSGLEILSPEEKFLGWQKLIRETATRVPTFLFSGGAYRGDPLNYPYIKDLLRETKIFKRRLGVYSAGGRLIDQELAEILNADNQVGDFITINFGRINFKHNIMRARDTMNHRDVIESIRRLSKYRAEVQQALLKINISYLLNDGNDDLVTITQVFSTLSDLGANNVVVGYKMYSAEEAPQQKVKKLEKLKELEESKERYATKDFNIIVRKIFGNPQKSFTQCTNHLHTATLDCYGYLLACCWNPYARFGNIFLEKNRSFWEIWYSQEHESLLVPINECSPCAPRDHTFNQYIEETRVD